MSDARVTSRLRERATRAWHVNDGVPRVLGVAEGGYRGLLQLREWLYYRRIVRSRALGVPVVSIGNLTVGGTGKTPAVELAVRTLVDLGYRPAVLSRGYGRQGTGLAVVADGAAIRLGADAAGDEPFLLARRLPGVPIVVGANRYAAGREAVEHLGANAVVLDDGFQHRTLTKDLEVVMVRARAPWGNGRLLPAGPLREPLAALARAHLIVVTGVRDAGDVDEATAAIRRHAPGVPIVSARHVPTECCEAASMRPLGAEALRGLKLYAFAGIGAPDGFRHTLAEAGAVETGFASFADHHPYTDDELAGLERHAAATSAVGLVTTEKDWARLGERRPRGMPLYVLRVRLAIVAGQDEWRAAFARVCPPRTR